MWTGQSMTLYLYISHSPSDTNDVSSRERFKVKDEHKYMLKLYQGAFIYWPIWIHFITSDCNSFAFQNKLNS